jgi:SAM-dependent methyltransferase
MSSSTGDFRPSPTAQAIADALRAGVAVRRDAAAGVPEGDAARLLDLGDLEGVAPAAQPGAHAPFVRFARRLLQVFLRPWLAAQSIFNREIVLRVDELTVSARDAERRMPRLEQALHDLEDRLRRMEAVGQDTAAGTRPRREEGPGPGALAIQRMFVHSRLPRPPARILNIGDPGRGVALELANFGFDVWTLDSAPAGPAPLHLRRVRALGDALPFADASFDAVLRLVDVGGMPSTGDVPRLAIGEVGRVLKPGGRLLAGAPFVDRGLSVGEPATGTRMAPLESSELIVAIRRGAAWSVTADPREAASGADALTDRLALLDERRPDASAR